MTNDRFYKTGDLARWLPDGPPAGGDSGGVIEFLGRIDQQVKIRGFRIELGEIEARLLKHYTVKESVVVDRTENGEVYLCAYIVSVPGGLVDPSEFGSYLSRFLPGYMIPNHFIKVDHIPLTVSGKIDKKALSMPRFTLPGDYIAPANAVEDKLAFIWSEVLTMEREKISMDANFFQLGGHSLKAIQLTAAIHRSFNVKIALAELFKFPTIRGIALAIAKMEETLFTDIKKVEKKDFYELSFNQKRLWFIQQRDPACSSFNMPGRLMLYHQVEDEWVEKTLVQLLHRHESLRTGFKIISDQPVQYIIKEVPIPLKKIDISMMTAEKKQWKQEEIFSETAGMPFDLTKAPLFRAILLKLDQQTYEFIFSMHHIITDGWSMEIIKRDFNVIYEGYISGKAEVPASIPIRYTDFAEWHNERLREPLTKAGSHSYWKTKLENGVPEFKLTGDFTVGGESKAGAGYYCLIEKDIVKQTRRLAERHHTTLFTVLFSAYILLLYRLSGEEEVACSIICAGREHGSLHAIVGFFVNSIIYSTRVDLKMPFANFLEQVKGETLELFKHQEYPLELIFEELGMRYPEIPVTFNMLSMQEAFTLDQLKIIENAHIANPVEIKFDLEPYITEYKNGLQIYWSYKKNMFRPETIAYIAGEYIQIIDFLTRDAGKSYLDYRGSITANKKVLERKPCPLEPGVETISLTFERQVKKTPDGIAVKDGDDHFTYDELNRYAVRIAGLIGSKLKLKLNERIGLLFEHGYDMIAAIIGTLKAGKVYVPLSSSYPVKRLSYMLSDSDSSLLLTNTKNILLASVLAEENHIYIGNVDGLNRNREGLSPGNAEITPDSPAYILYTSGSTGNPKGVMQTHENILYFIKQYAKDLNIRSNDRMTLLSSFAHDAAVMDIYGALCNGAILYPLNINEEVNMTSLAGRLKKEGITIWHSVPTVFRYFASTIDTNDLFPSMRLIVLGGEAVRRHDINIHRELFPHTTLCNLYGQTESSYNAMKFITPGTVVNEIVLGKVVEGMAIFIADSEGNEVLALETGEIVVACSHLALGYWQNVGATQKVFSIHPVYGKIYRTGDMGRLLIDGNIEFIGRKDNQVKIRGFRIELGEIESQLLKHKTIAEAVVKVVETGNESEDKYLCAYIVCNNPGVLDKGVEVLSAQLKEYLAELLPDYMIPSYFIRLERLPVTPGGKIDRKALPLPEIGEINRTIFVAPRTWVEIKLQEIWRDVLKTPKVIGITDDFFQLGGHSLRATTLASRIQKALAVNVPLTEIFKRPTIQGLAKYIEVGKKEICAALEPVEKKEYYELSPAQKRLYILYRMESESVNYNMPQVIPFVGVIDVVRMQAVFKELIRRHESLRTSFEMINEEPVQRIHDEVAFEIKVFGSPETFFQKGFWPPEAIIKSFIHPFDLAKAPLLRAGIIQDENGKHILLVDIHHIITDGTSNRILKDEFNELYSGNGDELSHLRLQYKDYAHWQNSRVQQALIKGQEVYWLNMFTEEVPVLNLPADYPRPNIQSFEGSRVEFILNEKESGTLKGLAKETGATLYISILSVFTLLLSRLSGQEDIIVGTPIAARRHADLEKIIGMFVNMLALRNNVPPEAGYREFVKELKDRTLNAYENQEYQFETLVEKINVVRDIARNPIFDVVFNLLNMEDHTDNTSQIDLGSLEYDTHREGTSKFDLTLTAVDFGERVHLSFEYCTRLFKPGTIERFIAYFKKIVEELSVNIDQNVSAIEIITQAERERILSEFNDTAAAYPTNKTIHQLFAEQTAQTPDYIALHGCMIAWMDGCMDARMHDCMDAWMDGDGGEGKKRRREEEKKSCVETL
ncbi:MAG: amino acid adenylation domain-containing protein, partial [Acidobacteria bacterium]|nr:amino acid adenylation domain-containing protein [Acidobacteriota bacterium]